MDGRLRPPANRRPPMSDPEAELKARLLAEAEAAIAKALAERKPAATATLADIERAARSAGQTIELVIATALPHEAAAELAARPHCPQCQARRKTKGKTRRRLVWHDD